MMLNVPSSKSKVGKLNVPTSNSNVKKSQRISGASARGPSRPSSARSRSQRVSGASAISAIDRSVISVADDEHEFVCPAVGQGDGRGRGSERNSSFVFEDDMIPLKSKNGARNKSYIAGDSHSVGLAGCMDKHRSKAKA